MGFIGALAKAGIAKRAWTEVRKPANQRRAKELFGKVRSRSGRRPTMTGRP